jgi:hypothetical protein
MMWNVCHNYWIWTKDQAVRHISIKLPNFGFRGNASGISCGVSCLQTDVLMRILKRRVSEFWTRLKDNRWRREYLVCWNCLADAPYPFVSSCSERCCGPTVVLDSSNTDVEDSKFAGVLHNVWLYVCCPYVGVGICVSVCDGPIPNAKWRA